MYTQKYDFFPNVAVKKVLLCILANPKYLGRKMKFSLKDSLPVETTEGVCDVRVGNTNIEHLVRAALVQRRFHPR